MRNHTTILLLLWSIAASAQTWHQEPDYQALMRLACNEDKRVLLQFADEQNGFGQMSSADRAKLEEYFVCNYLPITSDMAKTLEIKRATICLLDKDGYMVWAGPPSMDHITKECRKYHNRSKAGCFAPETPPVAVKPEKKIKLELPPILKKKKKKEPAPKQEKEVAKVAKPAPPGDLKPKCEDCSNTTTVTAKEESGPAWYEIKEETKEQDNDIRENVQEAPVKQTSSGVYAVQFGVFNDKMNALLYQCRLTYNNHIVEGLYVEKTYNQRLKREVWAVMSGKYKSKAEAERYAAKVRYKVGDGRHDDALVRKVNLSPENQASWSN